MSQEGAATPCVWCVCARVGSSAGLSAAAGATVAVDCAGADVVALRVSGPASGFAFNASSELLAHFTQLTVSTCGVVLRGKAQGCGACGLWGGCAFNHNSPTSSPQMIVCRTTPHPHPGQALELRRVAVLGGTFPTAVTTLSLLVSLELAECGIAGGVPAGLSTLAQLTNVWSRFSLACGRPSVPPRTECCACGSK
jgi:hypothetical protein